MIGDDLTPFFVSGEFAQAVTIGGAQPIPAIFDAAYSTEFDLSGTSPALRLPTSACTGVVEGITAVQVGTTAYIATRHEPDGTGASVLRLRLA